MGGFMSGDSIHQHGSALSLKMMMGSEDSFSFYPMTSIPCCEKERAISHDSKGSGESSVLNGYLVLLQHMWFWS
jgi:hypothetical protein